MGSVNFKLGRQSGPEELTCTAPSTFTMARDGYATPVSTWTSQSAITCPTPYAAAPGFSHFSVGNDAATAVFPFEFTDVSLVCDGAATMVEANSLAGPDAGLSEGYSLSVWVLPDAAHEGMHGREMLEAPKPRSSRRKALEGEMAAPATVLGCVLALSHFTPLLIGHVGRLTPYLLAR